MTRKKQLRALVSDRLAAAAEEILSGAERLLGESRALPSLPADTLDDR